MDFLLQHLEKFGINESNAAQVAILSSLLHISKTRPDVVKSIVQELQDQRSYLKMIASENYSSLASQLTMGNWLTDKYSEGYPFHRFYAGCDNVDQIEDLACIELKNLFNTQHAYVQPHSGADANLVAFWAVLTQKIQSKELEKIGSNLQSLSPEEYETIRKELVNQKMMGMGISSGGHLTHGYRHNVSAKMFQAITYDVDPKTHLLDYDQIAKIAKKEKPLIIMAGYSAYPRKVNFAKMREIAHSVGAVLIVDMAHFSGLVAGKVFTGEYDPTSYAHIVTSTTHKTLRGPRGGMILCEEEFKDSINKGCPLVLGGPLPHVMAAKAVAFKEANTVSFQEYAHQIVKNSRALAEALKAKGVSLFTDGTENHLLVIDVNKSFSLNGRQAENALRLAKMTVNRNMIPFDPNGPWYTSGIRIGAAALTTLGMKEDQMAQIASFIYDTLKNTKPTRGKEGKVSKANVVVAPSCLQSVSEKATQMLSNFPLYPEIPSNLRETSQCIT